MNKDTRLGPNIYFNLGAKVREPFLTQILRADKVDYALLHEIEKKIKLIESEQTYLGYEKALTALWRDRLDV